MFCFSPYFREWIETREGCFDMDSIAQKYLTCLEDAYYEQHAGKEWEDFVKVVHGVSEKDLKALRRMYPDIPESLVQLLKFADGTYWREYAGEKVVFYFLGSDLEEYPYYLLSAQQMMDTSDFSWLDEYIDRVYGDEVEIDDRIIDDSSKMRWLHFSDCMNNGGSSQLFIDFSPSNSGIKGQVVRYVHDPDELTVIADSFDEYLEMLIESGCDFINEDTVGEDADEDE